MLFDGHHTNEEQDVALNCIITGEDLIVQSPAGSGKTYLLNAGATLLEEQKKWGVYMAFNRAIAEEAKRKFPGSVECRTAHSIAFGKVGWKYKHRFKGLTGFTLAKEFDIGDRHALPSIATKGYLILDTISRFCQSRSSFISKGHVPDLPHHLDADYAAWLTNDIKGYAEEVWSLMADEDGEIPVTHDTYMKIWALSKPHLAKNYMLLDEFQDTNSVLLGIIEAQNHMQRIYVGDPYQEIYAWRGGKNMMNDMEGVKKCQITQSFRFGQAIADVANAVLKRYTYDHSPLVIKGNPETDSFVTKFETPPDVMICRTNGGVVANVFKYLDMGLKVYIQGGAKATIALLYGAKDLQNGKSTLHPDLALFASWQELVEHSKTDVGMDMRSFVSMVSKHGIPKLINALYKTEKSPSRDSITITTTHKAKGLEWGRVKLANDFFVPSEGAEMPKEERNVIYVACTRPLFGLDISDCVPALMATAGCSPDSQVSAMFKKVISNEMKDQDNYHEL